MDFSRGIMYISRGPRLGDEPWIYTHGKQLTREEHEEITQALNAVHEDFVKWATPASWTANSVDMHHLRGLLGSVNPVGLQIHMMSDHDMTLWQTIDTVVQQIPFRPRGISLEEATSYTATLHWGKLSFSFKERNPNCLSSVAFAPELNEADNLAK